MTTVIYRRALFTGVGSSLPGPTETIKRHICRPHQSDHGRQRAVIPSEADDLAAVPDNVHHVP
jgi:hypothetical protein